MLLTAEVKAKIDAMTYTELLAAWRFTPCGDPLFQGESGTYIAQRMRTLRDQAGGDARHTAASKLIGWVSPRANRKKREELV